MTSLQSVAFLGIGLMGAPMAKNLLAAGFVVKIWNRSGQKAAKLKKLGATVCETPAEAVLGADVIILMLGNGAAVRALFFATDFVEALHPGAVIIDTSSIAPQAARNNAGRLKIRNIPYLDAPVSGGTIGVSEGTLAIFVGGSKAVFNQVRPIFEPLGTASYMGDSGSGQTTKLASQIIVASTIGAVAEGLLFASAGGVDPHLVRKALQGGFADSKIMDVHGVRMLNRDFVPGGPNRIFLKDVDTAAASIKDLDLDLPQFAQTLSVFRNLNACGKSEYDHSSFLLALEDLNPGRRLTDVADRVPATELGSPIK